MKFQPGQSGNPAGRTSEKLFTDAIRIAALEVDPVTKKRKLRLIAEKLVKKATAGEDWAIGQIGDRLDGKPKERVEQGGMVDHAIRIISERMPLPVIEHEGSDPRIQAAGSVPALPSPEAEMSDHCGAPSSGEDGSNDQ
jgi:hypothetical protein